MFSKISSLTRDVDVSIDRRGQDITKRLESANITHLDGIHAERHSSTSRLDSLIVAGHTRQLERLVGDGRHGVVCKTLEHRVGQVVGQQEQDGPSGDADGPVPGDLLASDGGIGTGELHLEYKTAYPDDAVENGDECGGTQGTLPTAKWQVIRELADNDRTEDGADSGQQRDQGTRAAVEQGRGDGALVCVEIVGREEHGEQGDHAPVLQQGPHLLKLLLGGDCSLDLDDSAITTNDEVGRQEKPGGDNGRQHDDQEGQVDARRDSRQGGVSLDAECDGGADEGSHLEEGPEE